MASPVKPFAILGRMERNDRIAVGVSTFVSIVFSVAATTASVVWITKDTFASQADLVQMEDELKADFARMESARKADLAKMDRKFDRVDEKLAGISDAINRLERSMSSDIKELNRAIGNIEGRLGVIERHLMTGMESTESKPSGRP